MSFEIIFERIFRIPVQGFTAPQRPLPASESAAASEEGFSGPSAMGHFRCIK